MDSRMLLTVLLVLPLVVLAVYGLYRVADEQDENNRRPPDNMQSISDWAFPAVG